MLAASATVLIMAVHQDAENLPIEEPSSSAIKYFSDEPKFLNSLLPVGNADNKHLEAATFHPDVVVEDAHTGLSVKAVTPPLSQNSIETGSVLGNTVSSSLENHGSSSPNISLIQKEEKDNIPSQLEDESCVKDGTKKTLNEEEIMLQTLKDTFYDTVSDVQMKKAEINDDSKASIDYNAASSPSEKYENPDRVADAQINRSSNVEDNKIKDVPPFKSNGHYIQNHVDALNMLIKTSESAVSTELKNSSENRGSVDTTVPFESVKEAVTKFGGIVDWKAHKAQTIEKSKRLHYELEKVKEELPVYKKQSEDAEVGKIEALKELSTAKRHVEEIKLNLETAQTEAVQAKQDAELARLRAEEIENGISDDASVAAKTQLEVAKARNEAAVVELKSVKEELAALHAQYSLLVGEKDFAIRRAKEAVAVSKEMEKEMEDLTLELISAKDLLESAHAAHIEAEEHRIGASLAKDQDCLNWEKEIKQAKEELNMLNEQLLQEKNLKTSLETASCLLVELKKELAAYMESKLKEQSESFEELEPKFVADESKGFRLALASKREELEKVKVNIEKLKNAVSMLREAELSLKSELEGEKAGLAAMRQMEGMASITVSSLEAEIERMKEEIKVVMEKEREAREKMVELPKLLQQAALEADQFKSSTKIVREKLRKVNEEAERVKATLSTTEFRLQATLKEIEASQASERLALLAAKALQESEEAAAMGESPRGVTLPLEEYYILSKRANEVEEFANERVAYAISQIQVAKESELKSLQRLKDAYREMNQSKEALRAAIDKADKANEGKLEVEQELRKWRKASNGGFNAANSPRTPARSFNDNRDTKHKEEAAAVSTDIIRNSPGQKVLLSVNKMEHMLPEFKPRKKKSFFPRIVMFFVRRKSQSRK